MSRAASQGGALWSTEKTPATGDGTQQYVAGVSRGTLQSLVPLAEPFDPALATFSGDAAA